MTRAKPCHFFSRIVRHRFPLVFLSPRDSFNGFAIYLSPTSSTSDRNLLLELFPHFSESLFLVCNCYTSIHLLAPCGRDCSAAVIKIILLLPRPEQSLFIYFCFPPSSILMPVDWIKYLWLDLPPLDLIINKRKSWTTVIALCCFSILNCYLHIVGIWLIAVCCCIFWVLFDSRYGIGWCWWWSVSFVVPSERSRLDRVFCFVQRRWAAPDWHHCY